MNSADRNLERFFATRERCRKTQPAEPPSRGSGRFLIFTSIMLAVMVAPLALAAGEGRPIDLGKRNPSSGSANRETAIVVNRGSGALAVRPSNTAKGGRAISATCDNDGIAAEDGCAVYVNKGTGAAASFRTAGSVPFAIRETNTGLVQHLNADMVDGKHASELQGAKGDKGDPGDNGTADAFARVAADGTLQPDVAGFPSQNKGTILVSKGEGGAATGNYCFDLDFRPASGMVSLDNADAAAANRNLVTSVAIDRGEDLGDCPPDRNDARVRIVDGNTETATDARFFIWFEG